MHAISQSAIAGQPSPESPKPKIDVNVNGITPRERLVLMDMDSRTYTIRQLAREFAVTPRTLRFYEDKDLLHPARQGQSRIYSYRDRARLQLILRGRRLGFSLIEIKEMLDLYNLGDGGVEQLKMTLRKSKARIAALERQRADIEAALAELREGNNQIKRLLDEKGVGADAL